MNIYFCVRLITNQAQNIKKRVNSWVLAETFHPACNFLLTSGSCNEHCYYVFQIIFVKLLHMLYVLFVGGFELGHSDLSVR